MRGALAILLALAGSLAIVTGGPTATAAGELPLVELRIDGGPGHVTDLRARTAASSPASVRGPGASSRRTPSRSSRSCAGRWRPPTTRRCRRSSRPGGPDTESLRETWTLRLAGGTREIVIEQYVEDAVPALERLYRKLYEIPGGARQESIWRVRVHGAVVRRPVVGEVAFIDALEPMLAAIYDRPDPFKVIGRGVSPKRLLVDIRYRIDGKPGDRVAIAPSGRAFLTERGTCRETRRFAGAELTARRRAIERTHWAQLPDPVTSRARPR